MFATVDLHRIEAGVSGQTGDGVVIGAVAGALGQGRRSTKPDDRMPAVGQFTSPASERPKFR